MGYNSISKSTRKEYSYEKDSIIHCGSSACFRLCDKKVTSIGENAFYDNANLTSVTIPDSVTNITENAFCNCTALTSVTLPSKLRAIKSFVFSGTGLKSIELPASVEYIDDYAFMFCADLKTVTLNDGITSLGNGAFWSCTSLESIEMPDTVEYIGGNCFWDCGSLKKATISGGIEEICDAFGDSGLEEVVIQEGTGSIGFYAFDHCEALTTVTIPKSVTEIEETAFNGCTVFTTVKGYAGSYAEQYAKDNGLTFIALEEPADDRLPGDVDGDGDVDILDVLFLRQHLAGWGVTVNLANADVNADDKVNIQDVLLIRQSLAGWNVELV